MSECYEGFFNVINVENTVQLNNDALEASITQIIEIESERDDTLLISQFLDDIVIFEGVRHPVSKGHNRLSLNMMKIIRPRLITSDGESVFYKIGIHVHTPGYKKFEHSEMHRMKTENN